MSKSLPLIIGAFDGLHYGHQKLFNTVNGKFNVLLIANSPKKVNKSLFLISDRQSILKQCFNEINKVYVYDLRTQSKNSNKFIQYIKNINPKCVVVGNN
jgi:FAD synthase